MSNITIAHKINYMDDGLEADRFHPNTSYSNHLAQEREFGHKNA